LPILYAPSEDLELTISVIKKRYGQDISVFILGHSFGGMAVSAFVTKVDNQKTIKGWIDADGISDYQALGNLTRDMYLKYGEEQIALGKRVADWTPIVEWCKTHLGTLTLEEVDYINQQQDGEELMSEYIVNNTYPSQTMYFADLSKRFKMPLTAYGANILSTGNENSSLSKDITTKAYHAKMKNVTTPALFIVGKYDFICPPALHQDAFNNTASLKKRIVILPNSGHQTYMNEPALFAKEVIDFMTLYK
jgi:pimeloyl-ACP methyl ester carboxylesterase